MTPKQRERRRRRRHPMTELTIYQEIDSVTGFGPQALHDALADADGGPVTIRMSSQGGNVIDGLACYNLLRSYEGETTVVIDGIFDSTSFAYSPGVAAMTRRGIMPIQGGVLGSNDSLAGINAFLRLADGSVEMGGNFLYAINRWIRPTDVADIDHIVSGSPNIVTFGSDGYFRASGVGKPGVVAVRSLILYDDLAWMCGHWFRPHYKHPDTGIWTDQPGGDVLFDWGNYNYLVAFDGSMWGLGEQIGYHVGQPDESWETCVYGDGTTYTVASPADMIRLEHGCVGDLGSGDELYVCGYPPGAQSPVRVRSGGGWAEVGTNLTGWAYQVAVINFPSGPILVAIGSIDVDMVTCAVAMIEPGETEWIAIGNMGLASGGGALDQPTGVGGTSTWPIRLVLTGDFDGIRDPRDGTIVSDIRNLVAYDPENGWAKPVGGGVNGWGIAVGGGVG